MANLKPDSEAETPNSLAFHIHSNHTSTVSGKKVNHRQYQIEMPILNTSLQNYVHWTLNIPLKEPQNFVRKYSFTVQLLSFKYRQQNTSVSFMLTNAVTGPDDVSDRTMLLLI